MSTKTVHTTPFGSREYRNACGRFATGITIITVEVDGEVHGMTANGFMSVSLEPPLLMVSVGHKTNMHKLLQKSDRYAVSFLTVDHEKWSSHFAGWKQDDLDVSFERLAGQPVVPGAMAQFATELDAQHEAGDHTLYIGRVTDFTYDYQEPLLFYTGKYKKLQEE